VREFGGADLSMGSIKRNIQKQLFWPRNQILHFGKTDFDSVQAHACVKTAIVAMNIFRKMDEYRRSAL
jgi:hypothetical protein